MESLVETNANFEFFIKLRPRVRVPFYQACKGVNNIKYKSFLKVIGDENVIEIDDVIENNDEIDDEIGEGDGIEDNDDGIFN